jgi:hypothetical protein
MNEFEDVQRIWNSQEKANYYILNEEAMAKRIAAKKKQTLRIMDFSEWLLIIVNLASGGFILGSNFPGTNGTLFPHLMAVWMLGTAAYIIANRIRRMKSDKQFDRSVRGDIAYAISVATYQVRLSHLMRLNVIPIGAFITLGIWFSGKSIWIAVGTISFLAMAYLLGGWEHGIYKSRKRELEILKGKLECEQ